MELVMASGYWYSRDDYSRERFCLRLRGMRIVLAVHLGMLIPGPLFGTDSCGIRSLTTRDYRIIELGFVDRNDRLRDNDPSTCFR
ncbi:hypothetical protein OROGR_006464 [Orobanche gracilis]